MKRLLLLCIILLLTVPCVRAQYGELQLTVVDSLSGEPIIGAVATFQREGVEPAYGSTNIEGHLRQHLPYGRYQLTLTSIGYDSLRTDFRLSRAKLILDTLRMRARAQQIDDVVVEATAMRSSQRGDTLIYNASSYKTAFGADASTLLQKMPGFELMDSGLEAQGRTVNRVYVDGREFFGNDVMAAIRNIPSDMIESIEVYNARSDESEMAGIDMGDTQTSINIVTREDKRHGSFGRLFAGYGPPDKYIGGGNVNIFHDEQRLTLVGLANNIGRRNFSYDNLSGTTDGASGSAGRDFKINELAGISEVQGAGVNYSDDWGKKVRVIATYFFNRTDNENRSERESENFSSSDRSVYNTDTTLTHQQLITHRFRSRFDLNLSRAHRFRIRVNADVADNNTYTDLFRKSSYHYTDGSEKFISRRRNFTTNDNDSYNVNADIAYTYRFNAKKRTQLTLTLAGAKRENDYYSDPHQYTFKKEEDELCDTTQWRSGASRSIRHTDRFRPTHSYSASLAFTRYLSKRSRLNLNLSHAYSYALYDQATYLMNNKTNEYDEERSKTQSTEYDYTYTTDRVGATYEYVHKKSRLSATLAYQQTRFESDYSFPYEQASSSTYGNLTYNVVANIYFNKHNRLKIDANAKTSNPPAGDLQSIVNTTNRQYVFAGNPSLDPVYTHRWSAEYIRTSTTKGTTFTVAGHWTSSPNSIVDSLVVDNPDFVIDEEGTKLGEGNQYAKPINLDGFRNLRVVTTFGFPVKFLRSNITLRADCTFGQRPTIINDMRANLRNDVYSGTATIGSNISESVDFTLSYQGRYVNNTTASRGETLDNAYFRQTVRGEATFVIAKYIVLRSNAIYNSYRGITDNFYESRLIINAAAGVKLFRNGLGELSIGVNDLLNENATTFTRSASGTTLNSVTNRAIGRFYQLQFTYHLRHYRRVGISKAAPAKR